jgi:hypothetical protein
MPINAACQQKRLLFLNLFLTTTKVQISTFFLCSGFIKASSEEIDTRLKVKERKTQP